MGSECWRRRLELVVFSDIDESEVAGLSLVCSPCAFAVL